MLIFFPAKPNFPQFPSFPLSNTTAPPKNVTPKKVKPTKPPSNIQTIMTEEFPEVDEEDTDFNVSQEAVRNVIIRVIPIFHLF